MDLIVASVTLSVLSIFLLALFWRYWNPFSQIRKHNVSIYFATESGTAEHYSRCLTDFLKCEKSFDLFSHDLSGLNAVSIVKFFSIA